MSETWRFVRTEMVRTLWFLPSVFVIVALVVGFILSNVEVAEDAWYADLVFKGTASNARQLLSVITGTMITVTGLVFALTVVALQIASTQFSPRLLKFFLRDLGTRLVLSTFVATFAYSLAGLFTVGGQTDTGDEFLPLLAVTGALILALFSVGMLVFYIWHITNSIRIDTVMRGVERAAVAAIHRVHPISVDEDVVHIERPSPPPEATVIFIDRPGYVEGANMGRLEKIADRHGIVIRIRAQIGQHLVDGSGYGWAWSISGEPIDAEAITAEVNRAIRIRYERIEDTDIGFGLRQLIDVAMKAVAPSVADPYTAVQAVEHMSVVLTTLARVRTKDRFRVDAEGRVRVFVPEVDFEHHLGTVSSHIRQVAAGRPRVMEALLTMLETIAAGGTTASRRLAIRQEIDRVLADAQREIPQPADLASVIATAEAARYAAEHGTVETFTA